MAAPRPPSDPREHLVNMKPAVLAAALLSFATGPAEAAANSPPIPASTPVVDAGVVSGLGARNIGSATMSGRIAALAGYSEARQADSIVGAASGGVWKSTDGGTTFKPVFDKQPVQSIGAIAIDPSNPKTRLGRHRRVLDAQQRLDRRRDLQVHRRRRDLDPHGPAQTRSASPRSSSIRATAIPSMPACRASCGATRPIAACTRRATAARAGRWS